MTNRQRKGKYFDPIFTMDEHACKSSREDRNGDEKEEGTKISSGELYRRTAE